MRVRLFVFPHTKSMHSSSQIFRYALECLIRFKLGSGASMHHVMLLFCLDISFFAVAWLVITPLMIRLINIRILRLCRSQELPLRQRASQAPPIDRDYLVEEIVHLSKR